MNGSGKMAKKKWPNASESRPVGFERAHYWFQRWLTNGLPTTAQFESRALRWSPDGKGMALLDRDTFCCVFEVTDSDTPAVGDQ